MTGEVYLLCTAFSSHLEGGEHRRIWRRAFTMLPGSLSRRRGLVPVNDVEYTWIIQVFKVEGKMQENHNKVFCSAVIRSHVGEGSFIDQTRLSIDQTLPGAMTTRCHMGEGLIGR